MVAVLEKEFAALNLKVQAGLAAAPFTVGVF